MGKKLLFSSLNSKQPFNISSMGTNKTETTEKKTIALTTSFDNSNSKSIYARLIAYQSSKGLPFPQDVIRLAVAKFLESETF